MKGFHVREKDNSGIIFMKFLTIRHLAITIHPDMRDGVRRLIVSQPRRDWR